MGYCIRMVGTLRDHNGRSYIGILKEKLRAAIMYYRKHLENKHLEKSKTKKQKIETMIPDGHNNKGYKPGHLVYRRNQIQ